MIHDLRDLFDDVPQPSQTPAPVDPVRVPLGDTYLEAVERLGHADAQTLTRSLMIYVTGTDPATTLQWAVLTDPDDDQLHRLNVHSRVMEALTAALFGLDRRLTEMAELALTAGIDAPPTWLAAYTVGARAGLRSEGEVGVQATWRLRLIFAYPREGCQHRCEPGTCENCDADSTQRPHDLLTEHVLRGTVAHRLRAYPTNSAPLKWRQGRGGFQHGHRLTASMPEPVLEACITLFDHPNSLVTITR